MHLHSNFSDGADSIEDMVRCALSLGLQRICFTDHVWETSDWTDTYFSEIERCRAQYGDQIEIGTGIEAKLLDCVGRVDANGAIFGRNVRVVAAMHRIPCGNGVFIRASEIGRDTAVARERWLTALSGMRCNARIDCLAHPFSLLGRMGMTSTNEAWWRSVAQCIGDSAFAIEYNVKYDNSFVPQWFWQAFRDRVVPASDSHSVEELKTRSQVLQAICERFDVL